MVATSSARPTGPLERAWRFEARTTAALDQGGCLGWSLAIYDPEQDPTRSDAARIVSLIRDAAMALR
jgi:arginase